jgi:hypothetical protein
MGGGTGGDAVVAGRFEAPFAFYEFAGIRVYTRLAGPRDSPSYRYLTEALKGVLY